LSINKEDDAYFVAFILYVSDFNSKRTLVAKAYIILLMVVTATNKMAANTERSKQCRL
jgi:hypothetical protein